MAAAAGRASRARRGLGCTELPIVADTLPQAGPFVDPTAELAKAAIRFCGYRVKE